jgi:hypothetical protein
MKLTDLRRLSIKQQTRIHFRLQNGMECVITEHGIAQVPALRSVPNFNLEGELASARQFVLEPLGDGKKKTAPAQRSVSRDELSAMAAPAGSAAAAAHRDHEED